MKFQEYRYDKDEDLVKLFRRTFTSSEGEEEGELIAGLVSDFLGEDDRRELYIYIACDEDQLAGAIIFSRLFFKESQRMAFLLSPVAVVPEYQRQGIGQGLIRFGHGVLQDRGAELLFTYGDIKFYSKVGYRQIPESLISAPHPLAYPDGWLAQSLDGKKITPIPGSFHCHTALDKAEYW